MPEFNDSPRPKPPDPYVGRVIDKYTLISKLGTGGMGLVYRAEQLRIKRHVAIKLLSAKLIHDQVNVKRIEREAAAMGALRHPNIATFHDFGISDDGQPYLVMELIAGRSLGDIIDQEKRLEPERVIGIAAQVADAMAYAHKQGLIHRDLKPDNIMLDNEHTNDYAKVLDFGIAKSSEDLSLTQSGVLIGSPSYMSPEQCQGIKLDPRSDIYSLGVIIYEALTGIVPCKGATLIETLTRKTMEQAPSFPPELSEWKELERLTLACLATDPANRPPSMAVVRDVLSNMLNPGAVSMSMSALQRQSRNSNAFGTNSAMQATQTVSQSQSQAQRQGQRQNLDQAQDKSQTDVGRSTQTRSRSHTGRSTLNRSRSQRQTPGQTRGEIGGPVLDEAGQIYIPKVSVKNMIVMGVAIGSIYLVAIIAGAAFWLGRSERSVVTAPVTSPVSSGAVIQDSSGSSATAGNTTENKEGTKTSAETGIITPPVLKPPVKSPNKPTVKTAQVKTKHPNSKRVEEAYRRTEEPRGPTYRYGSSKSANNFSNPSSGFPSPSTNYAEPDANSQTSTNSPVNRLTRRINELRDSGQMSPRQAAVAEEALRLQRRAAEEANAVRGNDPAMFRKQYGAASGAWGKDTGSSYYNGGKGY